SIRKGETLIDTAVTLNAMHPDILVVRHHASGAVELLARKVDGSVINAGDGAHEHPTQALLDALTIRRNKGRLERLLIAICGDVMPSRVARSNIILLNTMGARVRVVAPSTLLPPGIERMGVEVARDMREGLEGADIVMMLRLQRERMNGSFVPSSSEYFHYFGLDQKKLAYAKPDALVMHPGPMNRGVEIDSIVADGAQSLIREQVEMGVAVRMAVLGGLARNLPNAGAQIHADPPPTDPACECAHHRSRQGFRRPRRRAHRRRRDPRGQTRHWRRRRSRGHRHRQLRRQDRGARPDRHARLCRRTRLRPSRDLRLGKPGRRKRR